MRTKLISYDLNLSKDYTNVIAYIQSLGSWAKPLKSQWLVKTDLTDLQIVNGLRSHGADGDDTLLVIDVTGDTAAWAHLSQDVANWINTKL